MYALDMFLESLDLMDEVIINDGGGGGTESSRPWPIEFIEKIRNTVATAGAALAADFTKLCSKISGSIIAAAHWVYTNALAPIGDFLQDKFPHLYSFIKPVIEKIRSAASWIKTQQAHHPVLFVTVLGGLLTLAIYGILKLRKKKIEKEEKMNEEEVAAMTESTVRFDKLLEMNITETAAEKIVARLEAAVDEGIQALKEDKPETEPQSDGSILVRFSNVFQLVRKYFKALIIAALVVLFVWYRVVRAGTAGSSTTG